MHPGRSGMGNIPRTLALSSIVFHIFHVDVFFPKQLDATFQYTKSSSAKAPCFLSFPLTSPLMPHPNSILLYVTVRISFVFNTSHCNSEATSFGDLTSSAIADSSIITPSLVSPCLVIILWSEHCFGQPLVSHLLMQEI